MKMRFMTAQLALSIVTLAVKVTTALDTCLQVDTRKYTISKFSPLNVNDLQKDDYFNEMWSRYDTDGEFKATMSEYPYGGGNVISLRHRPTSPTTVTGQKIYDWLAVGISVDDWVEYYWIHSGKDCRLVSPRGANFQTIKEFKVLIAKPGDY